LIVFDDMDVPSSLVAVQVFVTPSVGPGMVIAGSQPGVLVGGGLAVTVQCRITLLPCVLPLHQPLFPAMPSIDHEIVGVEAAAEHGMTTATSAQTASAEDHETLLPLGPSDARSLTGHGCIGRRRMGLSPTRYPYRRSLAPYWQGFQR
jgi:hypothetical protein